MARLRANAIAAVTRTGRTELDLTGHTSRGVRQRDRHRRPEVVAASRTRPSAPAAEPSESPTEELLQYLVEAAELREQVTAPVDLAPVVAGSALRIGEHFVGLGDLPESSLSPGIVRIRVGVCIPCKLTERFLDLIGCRVAIDAEDLVVVLHHSAPRLSSRFSPISSTTRIVLR